MSNGAYQFLKTHQLRGALKSDVEKMLTVALTTLTSANNNVDRWMRGDGFFLIFGISRLDPAAELKDCKRAIQLLDSDSELNLKVMSPLTRKHCVINKGSSDQRRRQKLRQQGLLKLNHLSLPLAEWRLQRQSCTV
jgi:hypothetical protein